MNDTAKEWAQALFRLTLEDGASDGIPEGVECVKDAFSENKEYLSLLSNRVLPLSERIAMLDTALGEGVHPHVLSTLKLMCERGVISSFLETADAYRELLDRSHRVVRARVVSASPLLDAEKKRLEEKLSSSFARVETEYDVDPSLIGGLTVEIDGRLIDGSLRHRLRDIKDVISHEDKS